MEARKQIEKEENTKRAMEIVKSVARAYLAGADPAERETINELFLSLDLNHDNRINREEFKLAVGETCSFKELDSNSDGSLDFEEILAFYYLSKTSVPRCIKCNCLLLDPYFSCLKCQAESSSYCLCYTCYDNMEHHSHHHSPKFFFDTRAKLKLLDQILSGSVIEDQFAADLLGDNGLPPPPRVSTWEKIQRVVDLGNLAVSIGEFAVTVGCNIM